MSNTLKIADEVGDVAQRIKSFAVCASTQGGTITVTEETLENWAARLSRYAPGDTEEVRLLRELRDACEDAGLADYEGNSMILATLVKLQGLEGRNEAE